MEDVETLSIPEGHIFLTSSTPRPVNVTNAAQSLRQRPTLLFIHAGVADHTMWDDQVNYFNDRGWRCLRYDMFGYGNSVPCDRYMKTEPRAKVTHVEHTFLVIKAYLDRTRGGLYGYGVNEKFVVIGLSRGAGIALDFSLAYPHFVAGLVLCAGGVSGLEFPNTEDEDTLFRIYDSCVAAKNKESAAKMNVRIWGDGTQAHEGRLNNDTRRKLLTWCRDVADREIDNVGGCTIPCEESCGQGSAAQLLHSIKVPTLVATGRYDESSTTAAMRHVAGTLGDTALLKDFETAHMINLEEALQFNMWVEQYLKQFIH